MPSAAVHAAVKARLEAQWTIGPVIGINGVTDKPDPTVENSFMAVQYPVVNADKPVLHGRYFEEGVVRFVLNVNSGLAHDVVLPWADTLATLFLEFKNGSGFETFVPSAPIVNDQNDDGNWFELSVIVPYRYQFNG